MSEEIKNSAPEMIDLSDLNLSEEELFSHLDHSALESEKSPRQDIPTGGAYSAFFSASGSIS